MSQPSTDPIPTDPNQPSAKVQNLVDLDTAMTRMQILQLAHNSADTPDLVVARAKKYLNWLTKPDNGTTPAAPKAT